MLWWTKRQEFWNVITHGIVFLMFVLFGIYYPFSQSFEALSWLQKGVFIAYTLYSILVFGSSCLYHNEIKLERKLDLRHLDQSLSILMIPFVQVCWILHFKLTSIENLLATIPILVLGGLWLAKKLLTMHHDSILTHRLAVSVGVLLSTPSLYLASQLYQLHEIDSMLMLIAGNLCHIVGVVFFIQDSKVGKGFYHTYWHISTGLGVMFHYLVILV